MSWTWRMEAEDGTQRSDVESPSHGNQSDAESWLGEQWRELAGSGVAQATLFEGTRKVYGPMPLTAG